MAEIVILSEAETASRPNAAATIERIEAYFRNFLSFQSDRAILPLALFTVLMFCWQPCFETVPYVLVRADTPSSGKTNLLYLLKYLAGERRAKLFAERNPLLTKDRATRRS